MWGKNSKLLMKNLDIGKSENQFIHLLCTQIHFDEMGVGLSSKKSTSYNPGIYIVDYVRYFYSLGFFPFLLKFDNLNSRYELVRHKRQKVRPVEMYDGYRNNNLHGVCEHDLIL